MDFLWTFLKAPIFRLMLGLIDYSDGTWTFPFKESEVTINDYHGSLKVATLAIPGYSNLSLPRWSGPRGATPPVTPVGILLPSLSGSRSWLWRRRDAACGNGQRHDCNAFFNYEGRYFTRAYAVT